MKFNALMIAISVIIFIVASTSLLWVLKFGAPGATGCSPVEAVCVPAPNTVTQIDAHGNSLTTTQTGPGNSSSVTQDGWGNRASVTQSGSGSSVVIHQ